MKQYLAGAAALALVIGASAASAQTTTTIVAKPSGYVLVNPEQEVLVQRYVVAQPRTVVTFPKSYAPVVGTTVPVEVQLNTFSTGADYGGFDASGYRYVVTPDNQTVVVEPGSRRVIQVIR